MENEKITSEFAWDIYNFINYYKSGKLGIITLQEALDKYFEVYRNTKVC